MSLNRLSGLFLVIGVVLFAANIMIGPRGFHDAADDSVRYEIIRSNVPQWKLYLRTGSASSIVVAIGYVLLSLDSWPAPNRLLLVTGSIAVVLAAALLIVYTELGATIDPAEFLDSYYAGPLWLSHAVALGISGLVLAFVLYQGGVSPLLSLGVAGAAALLFFYAAVPNTVTYGAFILFHLALLIVGILSLRS